MTTGSTNGHTHKMHKMNVTQLTPEICKERAKRYMYGNRELNNMIKYKNYEISRADNRNWTVERFDRAKRPRDITDEDGNVTAKKGEHYVREVFIGFYSDVKAAFNGIVKDCAGVGCKDLSDVINQLGQLKDDISKLIK